MRRTSKSDLDALAALLTKELGEEYEVEHAYGRPRLTRGNGSVDVSPRLSRGQLAEWMRAYWLGAMHGRVLAEAKGVLRRVQGCR